MGLLIVNTDFIGDVRIAQDVFTKADIDKFIARYEEPYLKLLLGNELFALFKADVDPGTKKPLTQIYLDLYDPILYDETIGQYSNSIGMKQMILCLIWFEFIRQQKFQNTIGGDRVDNVEVSREAGFDERNIYRQWNDGADGATAIQNYCRHKQDIYPTFKGDTKCTFNQLHWSF